MGVVVLPSEGFAQADDQVRTHILQWSFFQGYRVAALLAWARRTGPWFGRATLVPPSPFSRLLRFAQSSTVSCSEPSAHLQ